MANEAPPAAADVERRKKVRIRMRRDLAIAPQKYEGRTYYVVKDPVSLRYYRFKEQENFLIGLMDGTSTLDDAQKEYEKRFRPERLTLEDLEGFAQQLLTAGLAHNESPQAGKQLFDRRKKRKRSEWMQALTNILYIKIPVYDPDKLLVRMLPYLRWIFTTWFMVVSVAWMLAAVLHVATHFETFRDKLPSYHEFFSFSTVGYLWLALGIVKVIHEFGHGLSCKAFGGEVHEMGALFLVFSPCLYCNVSDAWTLPSKWKRIIISFAGIYVELIIAATATFVWWNTPAHPFINNLSLSLMVVCSVSTVVFNANPLMRYDGYYILADWLEIPNLRDRSNRFLQRLVMDYCLGIELQPEPYMELWRKVMFVLYAVISYIYRWVITFSILYFMSMFLKPYKLGVVSSMLALFAGGSMIGWPIYRLAKNVHKRGRLPDMKTARVVLSSIGVAAVLFFVFFVPLPVSRVRQLGLVQVKPEAALKAVVPFPGGVLEAGPQPTELLVSNGQKVQKNDVLALFSNQDSDIELTEHRTERDRLDRQLDLLNRQLAGGILNPDERSQLRGQIAEVQGGIRKEILAVELREWEKTQLELRAPCDGVVMSPPKVDEIGKFFEKGAVFCSVGDPRQLRVLIPVSPADYHILERDLKELGDLKVDVRVQGRAELTWHGKITHLPQAEARHIPPQLSSKGGGNVAIKPSSKPDAEGYEPQSQQFLVGVDILDSDDKICPGTMAYVKVHCKWRTAAWYAWRRFSQAFDLGMDWRDWIPAPIRWSE
jgi:putative peptide zinc metalloprotease protein